MGAQDMLHATVPAPRALQNIAPRPGLLGGPDPSRLSHPVSPGLAEEDPREQAKVRTGCKTCKIRHLKCDEEWPVCRRCQQARVACDGYNIDSPSQPGSKPGRKPKVKRTGASTPTERNSRQLLLPTSPAGWNPTLKKFETHEVPFFDFFRFELTNDFSGYNCSDFWTRIVLCEAMSNECVHHAVLAIAALSRGISESAGFLRGAEETVCSLSMVRKVHYE